eukprot:scaffold156039_cov24-Tisochrysis_lutea.AAC.4
MSAPAASSCTPGVPFVSSATSGRIAPAASIARILLGCWQAKFHSAKHACSLAGAAPLVSNATNGGSAPAATIASWLVGFWMAKLPTMPAAAS